MVVAVAAVMLVSAAAAQAHGHGRRVAAVQQTGDSTAFVHQIHWNSSSPARGVTLLSGVYSDPNAKPFWTVTIQAPVRSPFDGSAEVAEAGSFAWAKGTAESLAADGFQPSATVLLWPLYTDDPRGAMGVRVRVGQFSTQADANTLATTLTADGFDPLVEWTGFDPQPGPDAELLHVAIVDPHRFAGQVIAYHGTAIASKETAPAASAALNSLAATNGGFFTIDAPLAAVNGVNTGISAYNGQIESLANGDRAALVLDGHRRAQIENLSSLATLRPAQARSGSSVSIGSPAAPRTAAWPASRRRASRVRTRSARAPTTSCCSRRCSVRHCLPRRAPARPCRRCSTRREGSSRSALRAERSRPATPRCRRSAAMPHG